MRLGFTKIAVLFTMVLALHGCAGTLPLEPAPPRTTQATEAPVPVPEKASLEIAQEAYFRGVRAYVRQEFEAARTALVACQTTLNVVFSERAFDETAIREAESLRAKSDYFLSKIEGAEEEVELAEAEAPTLETEEPREWTLSDGAWKVTHGSIEGKTNRDVERWKKYFLGDGRHVFQRWLNRMPRFEPVFFEALARHGLPAELVFHAMIESGFSTDAYSWAHAVGLWQFIRSTARIYGLQVDWWVDERRDPAKASDAAARYLRDLYAEFQDWELALASYNVGEAKVRRQIRRQGTRNFWKLKLPRETRNHIPKFYAALELGSNPEKYGFTIEGDGPPETETIPVSFCADFEVLGKCAGVSPGVIAKLNPALIRHCTPPDDKSYEVVVPRGTGKAALAALEKIPEDQRVRWAHHKVRRGDTLSVIARKYRTTTRAIMEANKIRNPRALSIGKDLLIPEGRASAGRLPKYSSSKSTSSSRKLTYTVRKGDTLSEIAERHGTSSRQLRRWNRLGRFIHPGQKLTIYSKKGSSVASKSGKSGPVTVRVRRGDTLWDIARLHGVSVKSILNANGLKGSDLIRPGDLIKVPRRS